MTIFDLAMDYTLLRTSSWGHLLVCQCNEGFSYRMHGKTPVFCVPRGDVAAPGVALLAWLLARHTIYMDGNGTVDIVEIWKLAEDIFTDLCLMAEMPCDYSAFELERTAALNPAATALSSVL